MNFRQDAVCPEGVVPPQTRILVSAVVTLVWPCLPSGKGKSQEVFRTSAERRRPSFHPPIAIKDPKCEEAELTFADTFTSSSPSMSVSISALPQTNSSRDTLLSNSLETSSR